MQSMVDINHDILKIKVKNLIFIVDINHDLNHFKSLI